MKTGTKNSINSTKTRMRLLLAGDPIETGKADLARKAADSILPVVIDRTKLSALFKYIGGVEAAMDLARIASAKNERLVPLLELWNKTPNDTRNRKKFQIEKLCAETGVSPHELLGAVVATAHEWYSDVAKLMASVNQVPILEKALGYAKDAKGFKDRQMLLQSTGLAPAAHGGTINLNQQTANLSGSKLPDFSQDTLDLVAAIRESPQPNVRESRQKLDRQN